MHVTSDARLLKPVTESIRHDGAPFVKLSPTKGMKNASIIYQAIRQMPDGTLIRGDFDKKSRPMVYFPDRPPKRIEVKSPIKAKNIDDDRRELSSFLSSIVEAAYTAAKPHTKLIKAAMELKFKINDVSENGDDFTAGDIKKSLHTIAMAYTREKLEKLTSPHRLLTKQDSSIQRKRFREFIQIDGKMFGQLSDALRPNSGSKYDTTPELAVYEMKQLLRSYRTRRLTDTISFLEFLRVKGISSNIYFFAKRWQAISSPTKTENRIRLDTEPWAKEMDKICPIIEKQYRRSARIIKDKNRGRSTQEWLVYPNPAPDNIPPLPKTPPNVPPANELGPMSPKQFVPNELIEASIQTVLGGPPDRRLVVAKLETNPWYLHEGFKSIADETSDDLNMLSPARTVGSQSDLLVDAFAPRVLFQVANQVPPLSNSPSHAILNDISDSSIKSLDSSPAFLHEPSSPLAEKAEQTVSETSTATALPGTTSRQSPASQAPSLMMVYPKVGYSTLHYTTTEEDPSVNG